MLKLLALLTLFAVPAAAAQRPALAEVTLCKQNVDGRVIVLYVDIMYADGSLTHFDGTHFDTDATSVMRTAHKAKRYKERTIDCGNLRGTTS
jgi:hypothetical protein